MIPCYILISLDKEVIEINPEKLSLISFDFCYVLNLISKEQGIDELLCLEDLICHTIKW